MPDSLPPDRPASSATCTIVERSPLRSVDSRASRCRSESGAASGDCSPLHSTPCCYPSNSIMRFSRFVGITGVRVKLAPTDAKERAMNVRNGHGPADRCVQKGWLIRPCNRTCVSSGDRPSCLQRHPPHASRSDSTGRLRGSPRVPLYGSRPVVADSTGGARAVAGPHVRAVRV